MCHLKINPTHNAAKTSCLLCVHLPFSARVASLAFLLIVDLVPLQFVPRRWRCHQWKRVLQASLHGAKSTAAGMTWERVLEWENKNKQTKSQISAFLAFKVRAFSGERELKEGLGIFTTHYNHGV